MGVYKKAIITDAGEALRARAVAGEVSMQFSHAKTSTYVYPDGTDLTKLTDLQEIRQTVIPSNVQITNDTLISVRSLFGNEQINEAYLIQNVGVYATDGENEILFAVCQAITPDQMPAYDGVAPSSFIYNVQLTVSQAAQISLVINTAGTATTQDVLELEQKKVNGNGGDISETVITTAEESQAEYPVPEVGDSAKTVLGKVQKFFGDLRNWMTGVCLLGQIVNNCVTDNAKLPLSAAQGKVLMDLYNVLNTNQLRIFTRWFNQSAYIHVFPNIGDRTAIELHPDDGGECVWFVAAVYPRDNGLSQVFTVNRDAYCNLISGSAPTVAKYPAGSEYTEGYVRITFGSEYRHIIAISTIPSVITAVD